MSCGLEGPRRQPWACLSEGSARRSNGHAERRSCSTIFRILNAKSIGLTITLADITEQEFRVLELIEGERQEQITTGRSSIQRSR